ncbi:hypothetical protein [Aneurinibacillus migulanus]|uniref:Uncharacterized protein n=1 Tax=Aneurinibacillus migulanus TaxID=47500 RepID=A0A0D1YGX4_ANEMI|nr:hypothetical protein [Aneurinibacillus migulanus]KIV58142.1 hypothetical protein TS65_07395 [Aneurinibacillus migulanus]KON96984.1 hypothetical protein AF333_17380 [Aneurinibacillus migulanus]MED0896202.1 hypothetical protein [Aneurinibacillus migulanus]MED1618128.1 hypothetical protein [Aneurinibacillus migulanus]SDJ61760.1 hypothetical protein SAMN04487909_12261 [Aneurinibacillus migulanus]
MENEAEQQIINELRHIRNEMEIIQNDIRQLKKEQHLIDQSKVSWEFLKMVQSFLLGFFGVAMLMILLGVLMIIMRWLGIY